MNNLDAFLDEQEQLARTHTSRNNVLTLIKMLRRATADIRYMQALAGHPEAADGCRLIIKCGDKSLADIEKMAER